VADARHARGRRWDRILASATRTISSAHHQFQRTRQLQISPETAWNEPREDPGDFRTILSVSDRAAGGFAFLRSGVSIPSSLLLLTAARDARMIVSAEIDGRNAWVIWYRYTAPSPETPFEVWRTEWIDQADFRLLQQTTDSLDPLGSAHRIILIPRY
jgi:hypothetical protein